MSEKKEAEAAAEHSQVAMVTSNEVTPRYGPAGVGVAGTLWSANLLFTETRQQGPLGVVNSGCVSVELSWPMAKALMLILADTIQKYEAVEGEIPLPKSFNPKGG